MQLFLMCIGNTMGRLFLNEQYILKSFPSFYQMFVPFYPKRFVSILNSPCENNRGALPLF